MTDSTEAGESKAKAGDETIPKTQFIAAIGNVTAARDKALAEAAALRVRNEELERKQQTTEFKLPTRAELKQYVEKGEISQDEADTIWEKQITDKATRSATEAATRTVAGITYQQQVEQELAGYKELKGVAWDEGTPERARVEQEFAFLVKLGDDPNNRATELKALRAAFGDLSTLRASLSVRRGPSDTHRETGGRGSRTTSGEGDVLKSLNADQKKYYERGIEAGRYKDWDAVKAELTYSK